MRTGTGAGLLAFVALLPLKRCTTLPVPRRSTSPGGIAVGGYSGHMFWDMETCVLEAVLCAPKVVLFLNAPSSARLFKCRWMFPVLTVLYPDLARVAVQYRFDHLAASEANAAASGYDGAMWAWESASTGLWTSIDPTNDYHENHVSADIPLAHRRFFLATGDRDFLQVRRKTSA